jgi:DNA polymerase-3 subunit epsilon
MVRFFLLPSVTYLLLPLCMYAIVDIETTGGHAGTGFITEIAIILHNGLEIEGRYQTLVNPGVPIPRYVQSLTGITDEMVSTAPPFDEVASNIFHLLNEKIFIAHNVNFDYSFIKASPGNCRC